MRIFPRWAPRAAEAAQCSGLVRDEIPRCPPTGAFGDDFLREEQIQRCCAPSTFTPMPVLTLASLS